MLGADSESAAMEFCWNVWTVEEMNESQRRITLSPADLVLLNPNTRTCPVFRTGHDAELTKAVYYRVPVLLKERPAPVNPWGLKYLEMFHSAHDSVAFQDTPPESGTESDLLPFYQGKQMHHFDHRWAIFRNGCFVEGNKANPHEVATGEYYVLRSYVWPKLKGRWEHRWRLCWRDVARNTDSRTLIAAIIPEVVTTDKLPVGILRVPSLAPLLVANFTAFVVDYIARQKMGGTMKFHVLKQLPVLPPCRYDEPSSWDAKRTLTDWIRPRVIELTYTAWDLKPFAEDCGYHGEPFRWDEERRFLLRCELDAAYFHLYLGTGEWRQAPEEPMTDFARLTEAFPTPRHAVEYVMDTFPLVRKADEERHGHYRTKQRILEVYDQLATPTAKPVPKESVLGMYVVALLQTWRKEVVRDDLTLGLALILNDGARKTLLGWPTAADERHQLDDLPDYVVRLDELLGRLDGQNFIKMREHEGLQMFREGEAAPPLNQVPAAERQKVQEAIRSVAKMPPDEKTALKVRWHARQSVSQ